MPYAQRGTSFCHSTHTAAENAAKNSVPVATPLMFVSKWRMFIFQKGLYPRAMTFHSDAHPPNSVSHTNSVTKRLFAPKNSAPHSNKTASSANSVTAGTKNAVTS